MRSRLCSVVAVIALVAATGACGGGSSSSSAGKTTTTSASGEGDVVAQVASYELVAGREQRFLAGLVVNGKGTVVSFGSVDVQFLYLGTKDKPTDRPQPKSTAVAHFLPVPGQTLSGADAQAASPRIVRPSEGLGVYEATGVRFDAAGYWGARVSATIGGKATTADTSFEVLATPSLPSPGAAAPRTNNPTLTSTSGGAHDPSLDSRANPDTTVPDADLHASTIASALDAHRPLVVVVSTPVYCVSRFCGPITDSVASLAARYKDKATFVHLEVWKDFEHKVINPSAAEWIQLPNGDANEPWVFTVGRDGMIVDRFDNVASDAELDAAVQRIIA